MKFVPTMASAAVIDLCDDSEDEVPMQESIISLPFSGSKREAPTEDRINYNNAIVTSAHAPIHLNDESEYKNVSKEAATGMKSPTDDLKLPAFSQEDKCSTAKPRPVTAEARKRRKFNAQDVVILLDDDDQVSEEDDDDDDLLNFSSGLGRNKNHSFSDKKPPASKRSSDPSNMKSPATLDCSVDQIGQNASTERQSKSEMHDCSIQQQEVIELDDFSSSKSTIAASEAACHAPRASSCSIPTTMKGSPIIQNPNRSSTIRSSSSPPVVNPYRQSVPIQAPPVRAQQALPAETTLQVYPKLLDNSKMYPDERARFLRAFWNYGRTNCTRRSFERPKLDIIAKRIVKLGLSEYPIRSVEEFVTASSSHKAVTVLQTERAKLHQELVEGGLDNIVTPFRPNFTGRRKFYSIVEASLSGLLQSAKEKLRDGQDLEVELKEKSMWIALEDLIPIIDRLLLPGVPKLGRNNEPDHGASYLTQPSTRSLELLQIVKLETDICGGPFLKRHMLQKRLHFELLPAGHKAAKRIDYRAFPESPGHYRRSKLVHREYQDICIGKCQS